MAEIKQSDTLLAPLMTLWRKRVLIIVFTLIAIIAAVIMALTLPNFYTSTSLFYPASTDLAQPMPLGNQTQKNDYYGDSEDRDRLFSLLKSSDLKNHLIEQFDLYKHYDIDPSGEQSRYAMSTTLDKLFTQEKTKYDAIRVSVEDKDPEFAQNMINSAVDKLNDMAQNVVKQSQASLLKSYKYNIQAKSKELDSLTLHVESLRKKHNVYDLSSQQSTYSELLPSASAKYAGIRTQYDALKQANVHPDTLTKIKAKLVGAKAQYEALQSEMTTFNQGYQDIFQLEKEQKIYLSQLAIERQRYAQLKAALNSPFNAIHIIERGELPSIKSRPRRSIIVITTALASFIFICLYVLIADMIKRIS